MASLTISDVKKSFGSVEILKNINIEIEDGEFLVLVGPSGCGKSTLLNLVAGLEELSDGAIQIGDRQVNDVAPKDRNIAMVFQSYALYPNMTVRKNITFGMEIRKIPANEREKAVHAVADLLQIEELLDRKPSQLSGGQRQRVAMGRALVRNPDVFLFDEPLSNLDAKLRVEMRTEIKKLHQRLGATIVYVTHDQIEAMTLATRIAVMKDGILQQFADPQTIYEEPANIFVAGFIGSPSMNFIPATVVQEGDRLGVSIAMKNGGAIFLPLVNAPERTGDWLGRDVVFGIRPESVTHYREADVKNSGHHFDFECAVDVLEPTGADTMTFFSLGGAEVVARVRPSHAVAPGQTMRFMIDMNKANLFDPESGARI
ncbi:ABC transporter ATP-binding protein [Varunaivibrio sulfuroxidans]|uniref:Carbohydrate ABC transporter ATP-binding protein (CUT1 family) n=1 Tax=Varunaivibrio sulfuroxidans TaxID=1773489 RepID=A0A4V2UN72_9PROT|nr:ABC transporter ATP-binding protein [Varunaivibrio sulfuroxidans]TCS60951.1 carbohydrate ABC transporter ATP-binding protein (CUT1 family) [Varunaivibrio sulfuroxidans]WES31643.1 ABC transporter ATP-binding protein [Varunaivibrio sulfuroxidans]